LRALGDDAEQPAPLFEVAPDQQAKTVAELGDLHQRAVIDIVGFVEPPVDGLRPAGGRHHAGR
jgi:hypothetical protein